MLERYAIGGIDRTSVTVLLRSNHVEFTPLQVLRYEGFMPLDGSGELRDGSELFDLLLTNREDPARAVGLLERFGPTTIESVSSGYYPDLAGSGDVDITETDVLVSVGRGVDERDNSPSALIFDVADYAIVDDLFDVVPALTEQFA